MLIGRITKNGQEIEVSLTPIGGCAYLAQTLDGAKVFDYGQSDCGFTYHHNVRDMREVEPIEIDFDAIAEIPY